MLAYYVLLPKYPGLPSLNIQGRHPSLIKVFMGKKILASHFQSLRNKIWHLKPVSFHPQTYGLTPFCFVSIFYKFGFCSNIKLKQILKPGGWLQSRKCCSNARFNTQFLLLELQVLRLQKQGFLKSEPLLCSMQTPCIWHIPNDLSVLINTAVYATWYHLHNLIWMGDVSVLLLGL